MEECRAHGVGMRVQGPGSQQGLSFGRSGHGRLYNTSRTMCQYIIAHMCATGATVNYDVERVHLPDTITKAKAAGADVLVTTYKTDERDAVVVRFPGGYIAEIHSVT